MKLKMVKLSKAFDRLLKHKLLNLMSSLCGIELLGDKKNFCAINFQPTTIKISASQTCNSDTIYTVAQDKHFNAFFERNKRLKRLHSNKHINNKCNVRLKNSQQ